MTASSSARFGLPALLIGAIVIGTTGIFVRLSEAEPIATGVYRIAFSLPVCWLWLRLEMRVWPVAVENKPSVSDWMWIVLAGLLLAFDLAAMHWSIQFTSVANTILLANTAPLYVALGAWLILRERISRRFLFVLLVTWAGVALLAWNSLSIDLSHALGDGLALLTGVFYGAYQLAIKRLRGRFSPGMVMTWTSVPTVLVLIVLSLMTGESLAVPSLYGWIILVALGVFTHAGGQGLISYAVAHMKVSFSSVALLVQPVVAAIIAWWLFAEALTPLQAAGAAIVLFGIYLAHRVSR